MANETGSIMADPLMGLRGEAETVARLGSHIRELESALLWTMEEWLGFDDCAARDRLVSRALVGGALSLPASASDRGAGRTVAHVGWQSWPQRYTLKIGGDAK